MGWENRRAPTNVSLSLLLLSVMAVFPPCSSAQVSFEQREWDGYQYGGGGNTKVGDFDGDQQPDVLEAYGGTMVVTFLSHGFLKDTQILRLAGISPQIADFNGDGWLDVASVHPVGPDFEYELEVLWGRGGKRFGGASEYRPGTSIVGPAEGDFDGDGLADIAFGVPSVDGSLTVRVLYGDTKNPFSRCADYPLGTWFAKGQIPWHLATGAADIDSDGLCDFILQSCLEPDAVSVLFGQPGGGFAVRGDYYIPGVASKCWADDFNGDGQLDLAIECCFDPDPGTDGIYVLHGRGGRLFGDPVRVPMHPRVLFRTVSGDFDCDGCSDLAYPSMEAWYVIYGQTDGTFGRERSYVQPSAGEWPRGVADFDGDGRPDILYQLGVFLNRGLDPSQVVFLNFGEEASVNDPIRRRQTYGKPAFSAADFGLSASQTSDVVRRCLTYARAYCAPYRLAITTTRPTSPPYETIHIGGIRPEKGLYGIAQIASPYLVDYRNRNRNDHASVWTRGHDEPKAKSLDENSRMLANVIVHEASHNLGLWHADSLLENLIMYPSPTWTPATFGVGRIVLDTWPKWVYASYGYDEDGPAYLAAVLGTDVHKPGELAIPAIYQTFTEQFAVSAWLVTVRNISSTTYTLEAAVKYPSLCIVQDAMDLGECPAGATLSFAIPTITGVRGQLLLSGRSTVNGQTDLFAVVPGQVYDVTSDDITPLLLELPADVSSPEITVGCVLRVTPTSSETVGECSARMSSTAVGIDALAVTPSHDADGEHAVWPDKSNPPSFSWTDTTGRIASFNVDISADASMSLRDRIETVILGGRGIAQGVYTASRSQWMKIRRLAAGNNGVLYWRVRGASDDDKTLYVSHISSFAVDGGQWNVGDVDLSVAPSTLSWTHVGAGIVRYMVEFSADPNFGPEGGRTVRMRPSSRGATSITLGTIQLKALARRAKRNGVSALYYRVRGEDSDNAFSVYSSSKSASVPK